ncbi:type I restriction endonuclease subunit R, EcoR124 family [Limnobacter sp.]|uniref:type I restriction endonuclease subunit R, EcoR124 family n=1 Tax=Limnobacter sp. TaxID=2003368 RepID=UPI0039C8EEA2
MAPFDGQPNQLFWFSERSCDCAKRQGQNRPLLLVVPGQQGRVRNPLSAFTVSYILSLIEKLKDQSNQKKFAASRDMILDVLQSNPDLRSKRDLFETFIDEELDKLKLDENQHVEGIVITKFNEFVDQEKHKALESICAEFSADCVKLKELYQDFVYRGTLPDRNTLINLLSVKPKITKRAEVSDLMRERFVALTDKFEDAEIERD